MFIYAFSQYLVREYPHQNIYGAYWSGSLCQHSDFQLDSIFDLSLPPHHFITDCISRLARLLEITHIVSDEETTRSIFYNGYWLDKKYWKDVDVHEIFRFRDPELSEEAQEYLQKIKSSNAVSVHIRRGDYLSKKHFSRKCAGNSPMPVSLYFQMIFRGCRKIWQFRTQSSLTAIMEMKAGKTYSLCLAAITISLPTALSRSGQPCLIPVPTRWLFIHNAGFTGKRLTFSLIRGFL